MKTRKYPSAIFRATPRGVAGRRSVRWLNDAAVERAQIKSQDIAHQMKFMSPMKRIATGLAMAS